MKVPKKLLTALIVIVFYNTPAVAQDITLEMHWSGLFGPYASHPPPNDPLPEVTLFPFGEVPRPLIQTNQVPAKLGTCFGLLFTLHGSQKSIVEFTHVIHSPVPRLDDRSGQSLTKSTEYVDACFSNKPCYSGYNFETQEEILPGEWRMEIFVGGKRLHEAKFVVEKSRAVGN